LHCHGYGNTRDETDREYWYGIQASIEAAQSIKAVSKFRKDKSSKRATFYNPEENLQVRFEFFRELALDPELKISHVIRRYGVSRPTFYKYLNRFRLWGPWGLLDWLQPGRGQDAVSKELELRVIEEKLEHPGLSLDSLMARLKLKCSTTAIFGILKYWDLTDKTRTPVRLRGYWTDEEKKVVSLLRTAKEAAEEGKFQISRKLNGHFIHLLDRLKTRSFAVCDPGPIILAQFVDDFGVCEALQLYGPKRESGREITNLVLLNIFRILAGYETIGYLGNNGDRSVALAAGVGIFPGRTALYDGFTDLKFSHLQALRNDAAARARDLGLIRGERIAQDFHFKEFYGKNPDLEEIGSGPNSSGEICPGYRPHVIWDVDTDVLVNIAFCNGSSRATTLVREFCEKNLYPILDRDAIREIYMDSEYTSFQVINYFVVDEFSQTDVIMCLKRNYKIDLLVKEILSLEEFENFGEEYEIAGRRFQLSALNKELHLVVKRNKKTGDIRSFGTTLKDLSNKALLERYRFRWPIENGLKDLIRSYFIDHILGKDPEKIETNFYCVQVARLTYENFLQSMDPKFVRDSKGYKRTLATFRYLLFGKHNCRIRKNEDNLVLTYLDMEQGELQIALQELLHKRRIRGLNRVSWWGGLGLEIKFENQFSTADKEEFPKIES
jgi:hypothetical protein